MIVYMNQNNSQLNDPQLPIASENIFEHLKSLNNDDLKLEGVLYATKSYIKYDDYEKVESAFINSHLHLW